MHSANGSPYSSEPSEDCYYMLEGMEGKGREGRRTAFSPVRGVMLKALTSQDNPGTDWHRLAARSW